MRTARKIRVRRTRARRGQMSIESPTDRCANRRIHESAISFNFLITNKAHQRPARDYPQPPAELRCATPKSSYLRSGERTRVLLDLENTWVLRRGR